MLCLTDLRMCSQRISWLLQIHLWKPAKAVHWLTSRSGSKAVKLPLEGRGWSRINFFSNVRDRFLPLLEKRKTNKQSKFVLFSSVLFSFDTFHFHLNTGLKTDFLSLYIHSIYIKNRLSHLERKLPVVSCKTRHILCSCANKMQWFISIIFSSSPWQVTIFLARRLRCVFRASRSKRESLACS